MHTLETKQMGVDENGTRAPLLDPNIAVGVSIAKYLLTPVFSMTVVACSAWLQLGLYISI